MTTNTLIVGVDGSSDGRRALEWAVTEAARHGGTVRAITAWTWDGIEARPPLEGSPAAQRTYATAMVEREIADALEHTGAHAPVRAEALEGDPVEVLTAASSEARLLVLGSHGHSALRHRVLGSVSDGCIRRAACPVVVVPVKGAVPATA